MNAFVQARLLLEQVNPDAPYLLLTFVSWAACCGLRKWAPTWWTAVLAWGPPNGALERILGSLPSVAASAVVAALGTGGNPWGAAKGAVFGALAPVLHHFAKKYRGDLGAPVDGPTSRRLLAAAIKGNEPPSPPPRQRMPRPWGEEDEP